MITAVDTNVLLDVFTADARFGPSSRAALERCIAQGALVACDVVWAETIAAFPEPEAAGTALAALGVDFVPVAEEAAVAGGTAWRSYRLLPPLLRGPRRARPDRAQLSRSSTVRRAAPEIR